MSSARSLQSRLATLLCEQYEAQARRPSSPLAYPFLRIKSYPARLGSTAQKEFLERRAMSEFKLPRPQTMEDILVRRRTLENGRIMSQQGSLHCPGGQGFPRRSLDEASPPLVSIEKRRFPKQTPLTDTTPFNHSSDHMRTLARDAVSAEFLNVNVTASLPPENSGVSPNDLIRAVRP
jgi:hypothetical protein